MELTKREQELIKEAVCEKYKPQTELINRKTRSDNDSVLIKWRELYEMRKDRLVKEKNYSKNSIDWERCSSSKDCWIEVRAYLDARDMKTFAGIAECSDRDKYAFKRGFPTIEKAFEWAESQVDYKKGIIKGK